MQIQSFRDLVVWQRAIEFAGECYRISESFPADERFGMMAQLRRASVSVSSNIAEGHARQGGEFPHFLSIARGSLAECESLVEVAIYLGYLARGDLITFEQLSMELERMLASLTAKVRLAQETR